MSMDRKFTIHRSPALANLERRLFLKRGLSLGALSLLAGCDITDQEGVQRVLMAMSRWNDEAQQWLFNPNRLAPEFPESRITKPFPFNAYYGEDPIQCRLLVRRDAGEILVDCLWFRCHHDFPHSQC